MDKGQNERRKKRLRIPLFSTKGFLVRAVELSGAFIFLHAIGSKKYLSLVFGTSFVENQTFVSYVLKMLAVVYGFFYFAFVGLVPILVIGAGLFSLSSYFIETNRKGDFNKAHEI